MQLNEKNVEISRMKEFYQKVIDSNQEEFSSNPIKHYVLSIILSKEFINKSNNYEILKSFFGDNFNYVKFMSERNDTLEYQNYTLLNLTESIQMLFNKSISSYDSLVNELNEAKDNISNIINTRTIRQDLVDYFNKLSSSKFNNYKELLLKSFNDINFEEQIIYNKLVIKQPGKIVSSDMFSEYIHSQIERLEKMRTEFHLNANTLKTVSTKNSLMNLEYDTILSKTNENLRIKPIISKKKEKSINFNNNSEYSEIKDKLRNCLMEKELIYSKYTYLIMAFKKIMQTTKNTLDTKLVNEIEYLINKNEFGINCLNKNDLISLLITN